MWPTGALAVSPTSPVAHPLWEGPAGSPALVQEPVGAEQGGMRSGTGRKNARLFLALPGEVLGLVYFSQFMMVHRTPEPADRKATASVTASQDAPDVSTSVREGPTFTEQPW